VIEPPRLQEHQVAPSSKGFLGEILVIFVPWWFRTPRAKAGQARRLSIQSWIGFRCRQRAIQRVAPDVEDAIEARAVVLEGDVRGNLDHLLFGELRAQLAIELVGNVAWRLHHLVRECQCELLTLGKDRVIPLRDRREFVIAETDFSADGRIDVDSKRAPDQ
jgi:hypothetical protein